MRKHLNPRLLGFSLGTTFVVPNGCFYFLQIVENEAFVILWFLENQENKKLGLMAVIVFYKLLKMRYW